MKVVLQRTKSASVSVNKKIVGEIKKGYVLLVGFGSNDTIEDVKKMANNIYKMRVFEDENMKMNLNIEQVSGEILSISQFTLYADTKKGNRPSFTEAAKPEQASTLYNVFNTELKSLGLKVETGEFGADMEVSLINDGPVTLILEQ